MVYGLKNIVIYTENIPLHDESELVYYAHLKEALLFGPKFSREWLF